MADCPANNALIGQGRYDVNGDVPQRDPDKQGPPVDDEPVGEVFVSELPKATSSKIRRRELRLAAESP